MTILFKILVFLFLQQGINTLPVNGETAINWDAVLLNRNVLLTIETDPMLMEQALGACSLQDVSCQVTKETITVTDGIQMERATISFKNIANAKSTKIMEQLQLMQCRYGARLQWNYQYQ